MNRQKTFDLYKDTVCDFCYSYSQLVRFDAMHKDGKSFEKERLVRTIEKTEKLKKDLLFLKQELGFTDGLSFMENNRFDGFEIRDSKFVGSRAYVRTITDPMYSQLSVDSGSNYLFEVAAFINFLAFPECFDDEPTSPLYGMDKAIVEGVAKEHKGFFNTLIHVLKKGMGFGTLSALSLVVTYIINYKTIV